MSTIEIDVGGWPQCSGAKATLYLDPEDRRVYTFGYVGNASWPMAAHNRIHTAVGNVPTTTVPESLEEWIEANIEAFEALTDEYKGSKWDGSNHIGQWTEKAVEVSEALDMLFTDALNNDEIASYWDADEWFSGDPYSVIGAAIADGSIKEAVERECNDAKSNGAHLDPTTLRVRSGRCSRAGSKTPPLTRICPRSRPCWRGDGGNRAQDRRSRHGLLLVNRAKVQD